MERSKNVKKMIVISMMSAIGFILMALIEIPVPGFPPFLKIDISDITSLVTMILYGPVAGILVSFFKNFLYYMVRGGTAGIPVGEFANLLASIMLVLPTYYIWKKSQTLKGL
ncbi:MAG: ECF transporter S component, partial [Bacillaceae bacterium]